MNITLSEVEKQQILLNREKEELAAREAQLAEEKRRAEAVQRVKQKLQSRPTEAQNQKEATEVYFAKIKPEYKGWAITTRERTITEEAWTYVDGKKEVYFTEEVKFLEYFISNGKARISIERHEVADPSSFRYRVKSNNFELKVDTSFGSLTREIFGWNVKFYKNPNTLIERIEKGMKDQVLKVALNDKKVQAIKRHLKELTEQYPEDTVRHYREYVSYNHSRYSTQREPGYYNELFSVIFPNKAGIIFRLAEITSGSFKLAFYKEIRIKQPEISIEDRVKSLRALVPMEQ
jgi:hypothetical protein